KTPLPFSHQGARPWLTVRPLSAAVARAPTTNTWLALLPLTVNSEAPGPWIVVRKPFVTLSAPFVSVIVCDEPEKDGSKEMVAGPGKALAWATAQRSEPVLVSSLVLVTTKLGWVTAKLLIPGMMLYVVSLAVSVCRPSVLRVALKVPTPLVTVASA